MLTKLKEKIYIKYRIKKDISVLYSELRTIRERSNTLAICPTPTGQHWLGIRNVTRLIFSADTLELPQHYSRSVYNEKELVKIADYIYKLGFKTVVFSCYIHYFSIIINRIHENSKDVFPVIDVFFHGALSELSLWSQYSSIEIPEINSSEKNFNEMMGLSLSEKINRVGFFKRGLAEYFNKLFNTDKNYYIIGKPKHIEIGEKLIIRLHLRF